MLRNVQIVIADDDEMSLHMLSSVLGSLEARCTAVVDGKQALEALQANPATDLVLLDIQMPVMDGFEVLMHCRANPGLSDIPIIVLSADRHEKLKALKLGADDFLAKPYDMEELEIHISKLVQWRRLTQSAKKAKNEFLAIASHELRTPMHQIIGLAELLDGEALGGEQREIVGLIKQSAGDMAGIVRDILHYAQLDRNAASLPAEHFSLRTMLDDVLATVKEAAGSKGIGLEVDLADGMPDAMNGPCTFISRVFGILLENAVKFSSSGRIRVAVREERLGNSSLFLCSVGDQGIGIPSDFLGRIFEPFVQVEPSRTRKYPGIGLGLAIAKRMVELIGGRIDVESEPGQGSTFYFSFHANCVSR